MTAVLVHIDLDGGVPNPGSLVALAAGRVAASSWGGTLYAAIVAQAPSSTQPADATAQLTTAKRLPGIDDVQLAIARGGADKLVVAITDTPVAPLWSAIGGAWQGVVDHLRPRLVLFGADSPSATELGPRTAARIGAKLLIRARAFGVEDVELRDRDGGYVRSDDSGAAVALIGGAHVARPADDDIDLVVLTMPGGNDARIEISSIADDDTPTATSAIVVIGDQVANDREALAQAHRLVKLLGAQLVGSPAAGRAKAIAANRVVERDTALAPELCVVIGDAPLDVAGATRVIKIGGTLGKLDAGLSGAVADNVSKLCRALEES
ncbi:MAG: hypothetical protein AB7O24_14630 [Kofleriaceae bacterium]